MKYLVMYVDECGDEHRAHGTEFLEGVHEFPSYDEDDAAMWSAFLAWEASITERAQCEWEEVFGPECRVFLERDYSDMSLSDWARAGFGWDF